MSPLDLPEHDPDLTPNRKTANRFLELLARSPDSPEHDSREWRPARRGDIDDDGPPRRASHVFAVRDDVAGRNDRKLAKTFTGSLDQHFAGLSKLNSRHRTGVYAVLDPSKYILAEFAGEMTRALPVEPSLKITYGWHRTLDGGHAQAWQGVWCLTAEMTVLGRADIGAQLRIFGAKSVVVREPAHVRLPGFHCRASTPALVNFETAPDAPWNEALRDLPEDMTRTFIGVVRPGVAHDITAGRLPPAVVGVAPKAVA
jgi:hypothetical protein